MKSASPNQPQEPTLQQENSTASYTMWVLHCPFTKQGVPVLGSFGSSVKGVVIMTADEWRRLCADVPQLATTQFRVGS